MALSKIKAESLASGAGGKVLKVAISEITASSTRASAPAFDRDWETSPH